MKMKLISLILIIFCITSTLSATCDDDSMIDSSTCTGNSSCEWTATSTGTYAAGSKTTAEVACDANCLSLTICNGGYAWASDNSECVLLLKIQQTIIM